MSSPTFVRRDFWKHTAAQARADLKKAVEYARSHGLCPNTFEPLDAPPQHSETHPALVPTLPEPGTLLRSLADAAAMTDRQPVPMRFRADRMWVEYAAELDRMLVNQRTPPHEVDLRTRQMSTFWNSNPFELFMPRPPAVTVTRHIGEVEDTRGISAVVRPRDGEKVAAAVDRLLAQWYSTRFMQDDTQPTLHITSPAWEKLKRECGPLYPTDSPSPNRYMGMRVEIMPTRPGMPYMVRLV